MSHVTVDGNAFGLFVSSAAGITISDSTVRNSLEDGVVLHRFASSAVVERVVSENNGGDGFVLSRATSQVQVVGCTSRNNGHNGFTLSGQPLATGPSASGESTANYGSNSVANSAALGNAHYGIEVVGGLDVGIQNNRVEGGDMGIVARQAANRVNITGNQLTGQARHGIAVRDGVTAATISGNVVTKADTAIYVRDSVVEIRGNTVQGAGNHGVLLVGEVGSSVVTFNVIGGVGPSALDQTRAHGRTTIRENQTFAWHDTSSFWIKFRHYASPMTLLWVSILLLIIFFALKRGSQALRGGHGMRHPYADKLPLDAPPPRETTATHTQEMPVMARTMPPVSRPAAPPDPRRTVRDGPRRLRVERHDRRPVRRRGPAAVTA
ncbi:right-handed parallel beta-helix repeat-containing protein [Luedemannella flava]